MQCSFLFCLYVYVGEIQTNLCSPRLARCQDMSPEDADLDEIGLIFCLLNQWIVRGKNKTLQEDTSIRWGKISSGKNRFLEVVCCGLMGGEDCVCGHVACKPAPVTVITVENHQELLVRCTSADSQTISVSASAARRNLKLTNILIYL